MAFILTAKRALPLPPGVSSCDVASGNVRHGTKAESGDTPDLPSTNRNTTPPRHA
jgi:hypothetical protein